MTKAWSSALFPGGCLSTPERGIRSAAPEIVRACTLGAVGILTLATCLTSLYNKYMAMTLKHTDDGFWTTASAIGHRTRGGSVRGLARAGVAAFRGLPYAAAPVGELRFAAPRRSRMPHPDGFDATRWGATPQRRDPGFDIPEPVVTGDDTLNVNVFAPVATLDAGSRHPVLVWIHGGGYRSGSAIGSWYDGRAFARRGIVVVSISYRLAVDGFVHIDGAPENRGVLDWIAALEWVQEFIADFGGDPGRVTIAGQSAGGGAVLALLATRRADGLFQRAWSLSGILESDFLDQARSRTVELAGVLGLPDCSAESFATVPDAVGQQALAALAPFGPVAGEELFPSGLPAGLAQSRVPLVLGATADEMLWDAESPVLSPEAAGELLAGAGVPAVEAAQFIHELGGGAEISRQRVISELWFRSTISAVLDRRESGRNFVYDYRWAPRAIGRSLHCNEIPVFFGVQDDPSAVRVLGNEIPEDVRALHDDAVRFIRGEDPAWPTGPVRASGFRVYGPPGDNFRLSFPLANRWRSPVNEEAGAR